MTERTDTAVIKAGTLVLLSHGAYADYGVVGLVRALVDVDMIQELDQWMAAHPESHYLSSFGKSYIDGNAFTEAMRASDKFERLDFEEYHMGDYGELPYWYRKITGEITEDEKLYP